MPHYVKMFFTIVLAGVVLLIIYGFLSSYQMDQMIAKIQNAATPTQVTGKKIPVVTSGKVLAATGRSCDPTNKKPYACPVSPTSPYGLCVCGE